MLILDDFIVGFTKGLISGKSPFSEGKRLALLSARVWKGSVIGNPTHIISRLTWELPQTLLGLLVSLLALWLRPVRNITTFEGVTILEGAGWRGSICFGIYILLSPMHEAGVGKSTFMHEFGHTLQSRRSGPLYLFKYGIPSLLTDNHSWPERDANLRSALYFQAKYQVPFSLWTATFRRSMASSLNEPKWWEYLIFCSVVGGIVAGL